MNKLFSKQMTKKGTSVKKGTKIQVWVSTGLEGEEDHDLHVSGMSEDDAKQKLIDKGFKEANISVEEQESDNVDAGLVISTTPEANSKATEDTKITIQPNGAETVPYLVWKSRKMPRVRCQQLD